MSTTPSTQPSPSHPAAPSQRELRIYSHSALFYWWPVWAVGFLMALLTMLDGHVMAIVPGDSGDAVAGKWTVIINGKEETREGIILTKADHRLPRSLDNPNEPEQPKRHMAQNKNLGVLFAMVLLVIIVISNVPLRGLWSVVILLFGVSAVVIMALGGVLGPLLDKFHLLDIRMNFGGYFFISTVLFIIWFLTVFVFDRRHYMTITPGQVRQCIAIGAGETVYDTRGMVFMKKQDDLFRHWIVGLGSGDLIFRTTSGQEHDFPNVLFIGARIREIDQLLKEQVVV